MPNNLNDNNRVDQIVPEDQRDTESLADLFDRDGEFYTTDNRTEEERTADLEERERQMRGSMLVDGFFDDDEVRDRLEHLNKDVVPGMLKKDAPTRMMNDLRTYYLGKGECSYTTKEPVTDAEGNPVWEDNGERRMQEVVHTVPVTGLAQAFDLNNLPYEARKQIVNAYLTDLENHPFGPSVDDETAAASARYYASIHKSAMQRAQSSPWPGLDVNNPAAIKEFSDGKSTLSTWAVYSQDFSQNTEILTNSSPAYEKISRNRVRQAYLDEFGGIEEFAKLVERQDLLQGLWTLAKVASTPGIFSLKHRALAKYYLDIYNTQMKTVMDLGPEAYREGLGLEVITNASFFGDVSRVFPEEGAPTDAQLMDYLDGKIDAPFSDEYIEGVEELASTHQAENSRRNDSAHRQTVAPEIDYTLIYNLSYVPMPHEARDAQGQPVRQPVPLPDIYALTKEQQVETDRTFDRTLGQLTGNGRTGMQAYYCMMKGERTLGRFRIDGMPAMDYLAANGFPQIKADLTGKEAETAQKAALMAALADPARTVTFVPYVLNREGEPVEAEPMRIDTPRNIILPGERVSDHIPGVWPDSESAKYYAAFVKHSASMTGLLALDPDLDVAGIQTDERMKKALGEREQNDPEAPKDLIPMDVQSRFFFTLDDEGVVALPHDDLLIMKNYLSTGADAEHMFSTVKGTRPDGSLDGEGRKNLAAVKSYMNTMRDKTNEIADSYEKKNPILAEYARSFTDELRTAEDGAPWLDLMRSDTYSTLRAQLGGIGTPNGSQRNADSPKFMDDMIRACAGYPAGDPSFRLPQAVSSARRQTIMLSEHEGSGREGTQDARQDRASRRMLLSEMDVLEKELRSINTLAEKSRIPGSPEADYCDMMQDSRTHRKYLDNPASDSSVYYPRGTKPAWLDMQGKRAMLANGWPLEDLNLLGHIYVRRQAIIDEIKAKRDLEPEARVRSWERSLKVLDQIITELEKTPIRSAEDRRRMLQYIDSYGDNFYSDDISGSHPQLKDQLKKSIRNAIAREPKPHEFLSEEELAEARAAYGRYQERKNGPDPDAPTVNGPRTDTEYAFLNTERIGALYTMRGRLAQDGRFSRDPIHAQTLAGVDAFLTHVDEFYANTGLLAPEREAERAQAFDRLVRESATLSTQIDRSIMQLTDNGRKERFSDAEQKQLDALQSMQSHTRHMRSLYTAHVDYEYRRRDDLARQRMEEQRRSEQEQQLRDEVAARKVVEDGNGLFYVDRDYLVSQLTDEECGYLSDAYPNGIPEMLITQNFDGHLLPEVVYNRIREEQARREAAVQKEREETQKRVSAERSGRRQERESEEAYAGGAGDLFRVEERRIRAEQAAEEQRERQAEHKRRVHEIVTDGRYDWETRQLMLAEEQQRIDRQISDQQFETSRRQKQALDTGDERYTWSFRHILQDAYDKKRESGSAFHEAENDPENHTVVDITEKGTRSFEDDQRYSYMTKLVYSSLDAEKLIEGLRRKWPDWYASVLEPQLNRVTNPEARKNKIIRAMESSLVPAQMHEFLGEQVNALREDAKDDLRRRLLTMQTGTELAYEDQVVHRLHDAAERVKRQGLTDEAGHLLDENGIPYPPGSERDGQLVDEQGIPYPEDSDRQRNYRQRRAYLDALEYADRVVTTTDNHVSNDYLQHRRVQESAFNAESDRNKEALIASADEGMRTVMNTLMTNGETYVTQGVPQEQEELLTAIQNADLEISAGHTAKISGLLTMMEQKNIPMGDDLPGGTGINRAYSVLHAAQDELEQAVESGDLQEILRAKNAYEQARRDIDDLSAYVRNTDNFPAYSIPTNIDSVREKHMPLELTRDFYTNSKLNGMHNLYSSLKWAGISVQQFKEDPNGAIKTLQDTALATCDPMRQTEGKSAGEILGTFAAETPMDKAVRIAETMKLEDVINRSMEAIITMDPDAEAMKRNQVTALLQRQYRCKVQEHRIKHYNPYRDPARADQVQQLLSIVDMDALAENRTKMLAGKPLDDRGRPMETITAESYVAGLGPDFDGYMGIATRGEEILTDAMRTGGEKFDPVAYMENRQKALSMMLVRRPADRSKVGFDLLEDEIVNTAEYYESIRQAHPEANLPALTDAQKRRFNDQAKQYKRQMKAAERGLTRLQKEAIADRASARRAEQAGRRRAATHAQRVQAELERLGINRPQPASSGAPQVQPAGTRQYTTQMNAGGPVVTQPAPGPQVVTQATGGQQTANVPGQQPPINQEREEKLRAMRELPLTARLEANYNAYVRDNSIQDGISRSGQKEERAEDYHEADLDRQDSHRRIREQIRLLKEEYTPETLLVRLNETLGRERGAALFARIGGKMPEVFTLGTLTEDERRDLLAAMASGLPEEKQKELLAQDDEFVPVRSMDLSSPVTMDTHGPARLLFERQVDHPERQRVHGILSQAGLDWQGMSGGNGTQEELDAFRRDLLDADELITQVKPEIKGIATGLMTSRTTLSNGRMSRAFRKGQAKSENRYLFDLFESEKGVKVSAAGRQSDLKRAAATDPTFDAGYIHNVSQMMRRMDELQLLKTGTKAEESSKIYAFHRIVDARKELKDALQADMSVKENREKLSQAVAGMKEAQAGMDELMRMAKANFSSKDYMDNLDNVRNNAVPWQYARDMTAGSQVNAVWMFANMLKENDISIDEFEQHPEQVINRIKTNALEQSSTLKAATKGQSMGEIAACGACDYYDGILLNGQQRRMGQYSRGILGLIEADPGDDSAGKERNRFLYKQNIMGYASALGDNARDNVKCLSDGFRGRGGDGWEAIKTLTVMPEEDFDPDRMLTKVPVNTDGSRKEPFHLGSYLRDKGDIDYRAQAGRLEKMLTDAAKTHERIRREYTEMATGRYPGVTGSFKEHNYKPFPLVQARQQALSEMLLAHPENKNVRGYAELENEVLNAAQRYEDLRKKNPELDLPELTGEQKKTLDRQKKQYLDLRNNRTKLMGKLEDRIYKAVKQEEKSFTSQMKRTADQIRKLEEKITKQDAKIAQKDQALHEARVRDNERKGLKAYEEKLALLSEKRALEAEKQKLSQSLESLRVDRMKTLAAQYREGNLPYYYVRERLAQIDTGREQENLPTLFGDPAHNEEDLENREYYLTDRLLAENGANIDRKPATADHPMSWMVWEHPFWTEEEARRTGHAAPEIDLTQEELEAIEAEFAALETTTQPEQTVTVQTPPVQPKPQPTANTQPKPQTPPVQPKPQTPPQQPKPQTPPVQPKAQTPPVQPKPQTNTNRINRPQQGAPQNANRIHMPGQPQHSERHAQLVELLRKYPPGHRESFVHKPVKNPVTGEILIRSHDMNPETGDFDPGDTTLPRGILNSGDRELLQTYKELYGDTLRAMPDGQMYVDYLDQRINGLARIEQQAEQSRQRLGRGKVIAPPAVTSSSDGTILLNGFKQTEFQTASQGCWSVALSNLLRSRGVQVTQKDVRSFRATRPFEEGENAKAYETNEFNNDAGSDPFHDSELVMKTVPNTAIQTWGFEDLPPAFVDEQRQVYRDSTDDAAVEAIREQVKYALLHDHSPIAIKYCGHYQTIVGIKGNELILRDSLKPSVESCTDRHGVYHEPDPDATHRVDLYEIVKKTRLQNGVARDLSLVWLSELHKDPITDQVEELKHYPDLTLSGDGRLSLKNPENPNMLTLVGEADTECGITAAQEKEGLRPYHRTKFPNVIRRDLLRDAQEPSRSVTKHLTIKSVAPSPLTGKVVEILPDPNAAFPFDPMDYMGDPFDDGFSLFGGQDFGTPGPGKITGQVRNIGVNDISRKVNGGNQILGNGIGGSQTTQRKNMTPGTTKLDTNRKGMNGQGTDQPNKNRFLP